jgi:hypothetical protein
MWNCKIRGYAMDAIYKNKTILNCYHSLHFHWNDLLHFFLFVLLIFLLSALHFSSIGWEENEKKDFEQLTSFLERKKILSTFCVLAPSLWIDLIFSWMQTFLTIRFGRLINYISRNLMKEWTVLISSVIMIRLSWMGKNMNWQKML